MERIPKKVKGPRVPKYLKEETRGFCSHAFGEGVKTKHIVHAIRKDAETPEPIRGIFTRPLKSS